MTGLIHFINQFNGWGMPALRLAIAIVFVVHGVPKVKNPAGIASAYGAPKFVGLLHGLVEVLGAVALVAGYQRRQAALLLAVIMLGAIYFKKFKWKIPFWARDNTGWEFDLVLLGGLLAILLG